VETLKANFFSRFADGQTFSCSKSFLGNNSRRKASFFFAKQAKESSIVKYARRLHR